MHEMNIHTLVRPHKCTICSKAFTEKSKLQQHMRSHTGEKPYECKVCSAKFSLSNSLAVHSRFHTGEKSHHCSECDYSSVTASGLNWHKRIHSRPSGRHKCTVCGACFSKSYFLERLTYRWPGPYVRERESRPIGER